MGNDSCFLFWGTYSQLSYSGLATLLDAGIRPSAVMIAGTENNAPQLIDLPNIIPLSANLQNIIQLGIQQGIPVWQVGKHCTDEVCEWLANFKADLAMVVCYPWRIPAPLLKIPRFGFFNLHPSKLPAFRGSAPVFWQLRAGLTEIGITLHQMDADFDTGKIVAQSSFQLPTGATGRELDQLCGKVGGKLLIEQLPSMLAGKAKLTPQPTGGDYQTFPASADFELLPSWSVTHAFNFMRGTDQWRMAYHGEFNGRQIQVRKAVRFASGKQSKGVESAGNLQALPFADGILYAK